MFIGGVRGKRVTEKLNKACNDLKVEYYLKKIILIE